HALRAGAGVENNREGFLDRRGTVKDALGIDHRNRAWHVIFHGSAVVRRNVLIKFPGFRAKAALLEAIGGFQAVGGCAAVKSDRANNFMGVRSRGRDERDVRKRSFPIPFTRTRDHDQMMLGIETEFVSSGCPADRDSVGAAQNIFTWVSGIKYPDPPRSRARS